MFPEIRQHSKRITQEFNFDNYLEMSPPIYQHILLQLSLWTTDIFMGSGIHIAGKFRATE